MQIHHALSSVASVAPGQAYRLRLASDPATVRQAQALRFEVFNLELDEGLADSYDSGLDADPFDEVCDHLVVEDARTDSVVGTYRLQTGTRALSRLGYYSGQEFDMSPFEPVRDQVVELGRACIHQRHRQFSVLNLLWKGIAAYAQAHGARYLVGCSSLNAQDAAVGAAAWQSLSHHLAPPAWRTAPRPGMACPLGAVASPPPAIPRLLSAYLALGAAICGPPAIDRAFRTIDFLTWVDIESAAARAFLRRGRTAT